MTYTKLGPFSSTNPDESFVLDITSSTSQELYSDAAAEGDKQHSLFLLSNKELPLQAEPEPNSSHTITTSIGTDINNDGHKASPSRKVLIIPSQNGENSAPFPAPFFFPGPSELLQHHPDLHQRQLQRDSMSYVKEGDADSHQQHALEVLVDMVTAPTGASEATREHTESKQTANKYTSTALLTSTPKVADPLHSPNRATAGDSSHSLIVACL